MSILRSLDQTTVEALSEIIGSGILPTLSIVNTKYVGRGEEFSGTALLVSDGRKRYIFTANHVLEPSQRNPPRSDKVELSYHSFGLAKGHRSNRPHAIRRRYWRSLNHDLAIAESSISERLDIDPKLDYYPLDKLTQPLAFDPHLDDLFVVCGFPADKRLSIPLVAEIKHGMLIHYFSGRDGRQDPNVTTRFRIKFNSGELSPGGLSGSPVWLVRNSANVREPLSVEHLKSLSGQECRLVAQVIGVVTEYFEASGEIAAVKSEVCADFIKQALNVLPSLRSVEEDEWIDQQLRRY